MGNTNMSVRGFERGRYVRELQDPKAPKVFHTTMPERKSNLTTNNNLRRIEAIKLHDKRLTMGLPVHAMDPRYRHLHATKGWKIYPA